MKLYKKGMVFNMKDIITRLDITDNVSLVTVENLKNDIQVITDLFKALADAHIDLDMITQTPLVKSNEVSLSFTISDNDMQKAVSVVGSFKKNSPRIFSEVNSGNAKICIYGHSMRGTPGVAAALFETLKQNEVEVRIITTSETEISILVSDRDTDRATKAIKNTFGIQ